MYLLITIFSFPACHQWEKKDTKGSAVGPLIAPPHNKVSLSQFFERNIGFSPKKPVLLKSIQKKIDLKIIYFHQKKLSKTSFDSNLHILCDPLQWPKYCNAKFKLFLEDFLFDTQRKTVKYWTRLAKMIER